MNNVIDDLKQAANALASKIDDIRNTSVPEVLHAYSDLIMGMLRAERIFIKEETVAKYINGEEGYTANYRQNPNILCNFCLQKALDSN